MVQHIHTLFVQRYYRALYYPWLNHIHYQKWNSNNFMQEIIINLEIMALWSGKKLINDKISVVSSFDVAASKKVHHYTQFYCSYFTIRACWPRTSYISLMYRYYMKKCMNTRVSFHQVFFELFAQLWTNNKHNKSDAKINICFLLSCLLAMQLWGMIEWGLLFIEKTFARNQDWSFLEYLLLEILWWRVE